MYDEYINYRSMNVGRKRKASGNKNMIWSVSTKNENVRIILYMYMVF